MPNQRSGRQLRCADTPGKGESGRCDSEGDDVGEGIDFAAEITDGVRHARDFTVHAVGEDGQTNCQGGVIVEAGGLIFHARWKRDCLHGLHQAVITAKQGSRGKQRGQGKGPVAVFSDVRFAHMRLIHR